MALSCVYRAQGSGFHGAGHLIDILRGNRRNLQRGHEKFRHSVLAPRCRTGVARSPAVVAFGCLRSITTVRTLCSPTRKARAQGQQNVTLRKYVNTRTRQSSSDRANARARPRSIIRKKARWERLRVAFEQRGDGVPAYVIFHDARLRKSLATTRFDRGSASNSGSAHANSTFGDCSRSWRD